MSLLHVLLHDLSCFIRRVTFTGIGVVQYPFIIVEAYLRIEAKLVVARNIAEVTL